MIAEPINFTLNVYAIPFFTVGLLMAYIGINNLLKHTHFYFSQSFGLLCLAFSIWLTGTGLIFSIPHDSSSSLIFNIRFIGITFIPSLFYRFSIVFLKIKSSFFIKQSIYLLIISALFFILTLDKNFGFITGSYTYYFGHLPRYGVTSILFLTFFAYCNFVAFSLWWRTYRQTTDIFIKRRLGMLFISSLFTTLASIDFLPCFGFEFFPFGVIFIFLFISFMSYALYVYHSIAIQTLFNNLLTLLLCISISFILWFTIMLSFYKPAPPLSLVNFFTLLFSLITVFTVFRFAPIFISYLINGNKYQNDFFKFNSIVQLKHPFKCMCYIAKISSEITSTRYINFVLYNQAKEHFEYYSINNELDHTSPSLPESSHCLYKLGLINWDEIVQSATLDKTVQKQAISLFNKLNAQIILPIIHYDKIVSILCIGRLTDPIFSNPLSFDLLRQLVPYATAAISNALYYDQIRQLSKNLWEANEQLQSNIQKRTNALESALNQIKVLFEDQSNFFTMALHNLRTPLTSITAATSILWQSTKTSDKENIYTILDNNINRLDSLSLDIVEIAKISGLKNNLKYLKVDINELINDQFLQINKLYANKQIQWHYFQNDNIKYIHVDSQQIKLVFHNLILNAFKYCPAHSKIVTTLKLASRQDLEKYCLGNLNQPDDFFEFSISDNGTGIPDNMQAHIFDSFVQGMNSQYDSESTGLGLYIVKRILENQGGAITFQSSPTNGTTFFFIIPT